MKNPRGSRSPTAPPPAPKRLRYEEVRDLFLKEPPETDEEALDFYAHLGMYIYGRWQSIAADTPAGQALDENSSTRWDDCTDHEFDEIRGRAEELIDREVARRRIVAFMASVVAKPWGTFLKIVAWIGMRFLEALVAAIALILWAILFVHIYRPLVDDAKAALHDDTPVTTKVVKNSN